jgi:hypothetical protein
MKTSRKTPAKTLGANGGDPAHKQQKHDANFAQSRDVREDRGQRQIKTSVKSARGR